MKSLLQYRKVYDMVNSTYKSLIENIGSSSGRLMCVGLHVFVQVCACVVVCPVCTRMCACQSVIICVSVCVCGEWAPCQAAGATFSFSLRSRRSFEQRSLILSTGACGLEACCCLLACPPPCSCRQAGIKVLLLSCFIPT